MAQKQLMWGHYIPNPKGAQKSGCYDFGWLCGVCPRLSVAQISFLNLILISELHKEALLKILNEPQVSKDISPG